MVKSILINFLSNLGDTIVSLPALDRLKTNYPDSKITAIASLKTKTFLLENNFIDEVILYNKLWPWGQKLKFVLDLRGKYDLMIDLKNTFLPVALGVRKSTSFVRKFPKGMHAKDEVLSLIAKVAPKEARLKSELILEESKKKNLESLKLKKSVFIACSSREKLKQYPYEYLKVVVSELIAKHSVAILGVAKDRDFYKDILYFPGVIDLVGKTEMNEVYFLLKNYVDLLLCVDSSIMHLASYLDLPIVALFGHSDPVRYGPWSAKYSVLQKNKYMAPSSAQRKQNYQVLLKRMEIEPEQVLKAIEKTIGK
ncbi:MAG: glycosyltransferase family 9 protein [Candidatus Omnitrophica bacterium]|nr:glycosyltransferase family 9 protein [Candidatus Omnitrophota bacterium]